MPRLDFRTALAMDMARKQLNERTLGDLLGAVLFARALAETHGYTVEDNTTTHECHVVHLPSDDSEGGLT